MNVSMEFEPHTIIMFVGPTECGKTTFYNQVLKSGLAYENKDKGLDINVRYLSSDDIRRDILGEDLDKHESRMMESSEVAFGVLFNQLRAVTTFPVNAEYVVLDTTGLSTMFREKVLEIAEDNQYKVDVVVFDYSDVKEYYMTEKSKRIVERHVGTLKKQTMKELSKKKYHQVHKIRSKHDVVQVKSRLSGYVENHLDIQGDYVYVGDVHENVEALKGLMRKEGFKFKDIGNGIEQVVPEKGTLWKRFVLVGDFIDKGNNTFEMIDFLTANQLWFKMVKGNHENFVYKYLRGEVAGVAEDVMENYFTAIRVLEDDEEYKEKFFRLVENMKDFIIYKGNGSRKTVYVTHAPVRYKYVGKMDKESVKNQRNLRLNRDMGVEEQLDFVKEQAVFNHPYHVFGHVMSKNVVRLGSAVGIDTGAGSGYKLTGVKLDGDRPYFNSVSVGGESREELPALFKKEKKIDVKNLDKEDLKRLNHVCRNGVNYISGTMSPADKLGDKLESIEAALAYYGSKGVSQVMIQPKYMGSRCNVYLNKDIGKCYAVSRGGFVVNRVDLTEVYEKLLGKYREYMERENVDYLVLDGELLPWSAMGSSLIEHSFKPLVTAVQSELDKLEEYGFEAELRELLESDRREKFKKDRAEMGKKKLAELYSNLEYRNFNSLEGFHWESVESQREGLNIYREQVGIYGEDTRLDYAPFAVLKVVYEDGWVDDKLGEELFSNVKKMYEFCTDDDYLVVDVKEEGEAREFYQSLVSDRSMEGVVIKPMYFEDIGKVVPALKVRNENYLTLVYGVDYRKEEKYRKLVDKKKVYKKMELSRKEYMKAKEMLKVNLKEVNEENGEYKQLVADLLFEVRNEEGLDPRL